MPEVIFDGELVFEGPPGEDTVEVPYPDVPVFSEFPETAVVDGVEMGKDSRAWTAFCDIYAPLDMVPDGGGGVTYSYTVIQEMVPGMFKTFSDTNEGLVNGAVRSRERWGQVFFPAGTFLEVTYRVLADSQFYEVIACTGIHEGANVPVVVAELARIGPNSENDI